MNATLLVVTWLAATGPQVSAQALPDLAACRQVMTSLAEDLAQMARSNLTRSHQTMLKSAPPR